MITVETRVHPLVASRPLNGLLIPIGNGDAPNGPKRAREADYPGRMPSYGMVAVAANVDNEDGPHVSSAQIFQARNDGGWTIRLSHPAAGAAR